jgi:CubicO group peptidase (beta-lactamase class C family)
VPGSQNGSAAASRGGIDYSAPVARYWPEFAAAGKQDVTVAMLLSHQAGLCGFRDPAQMEDFYDAEAAAARLAAAEPFWEPGTQSGYHAITIGFLGTVPPGRRPQHSGFRAR